MTMRLEVDSTEYEGFLSASVTLRLDALTNTFAFKATSADGAPLPFVGGEGCRVVVDGEAVLTGWIEIVNESHSATSHSISIQGRDLTSDLVDSTLPAINDIRGLGLTLKGMIERVLQEIESAVKVIDLTPIEPFSLTEDTASPDPGEGAFDFIEKYARKKQVLLTSDGDANVVITQSSGVRINASLQHIKGSDDNNVLEADVSYDSTGLFRTYEVISSRSFSPLNAAGVSDLATATDQRGGTTDVTQRFGRKLVLVAETGASSDQNLLRAEWEASIRRARSRVYSATVQGYRNQTGALWAVNTLVSVVDTYSDIDSQMLINSVVFTIDGEGGSVTALTLLPSDAYTLELNEPVSTKGDVGGQTFI